MVVGAAAYVASVRGGTAGVLPEDEEERKERGGEEPSRGRRSYHRRRRSDLRHRDSRPRRRPGHFPPTPSVPSRRRRSRRRRAARPRGRARRRRRRPTSDAAGWTLAYQMGIEVDRIMEGFDGPFEALPYGQLLVPEPSVLSSSASGYLLDARVNDSFKAVNDLLKGKVKVYRTQSAVGSSPAGSFYVPSAGKKILEILIEAFK